MYCFYEILKTFEGLILSIILEGIQSNINEIVRNNRFKKIISKIENESPIELQAIGIGHDVTKYYKNALTINRAEELGEVLLDELTKLFND